MKFLTSAMCKTSISINFSSVEDRAVKFICSMGFLAMWIQWHDRHLCHMTGCDHCPRLTEYMYLRVVCLTGFVQILEKYGKSWNLM